MIDTDEAAQAELLKQLPLLPPSMRTREVREWFVIAFKLGAAWGGQKAMEMLTEKKS